MALIRDFHAPQFDAAAQRRLSPKKTLPSCDMQTPNLQRSVRHFSAQQQNKKARRSSDAANSEDMT
jgi:hypothetical protein